MPVHIGLIREPNALAGNAGIIDDELGLLAPG
jgi:hypothetical protein